MGKEINAKRTWKKSRENWGENRAVFSDACFIDRMFHRPQCSMLAKFMAPFL